MEMLNVNGIKEIAANVGRASEKSLQSTSLMLCIIKTPTMMRAGAVANPGTAATIGEKNKPNTRKQTATVKAVRPVLPPAATPEALST